MNLRNLDQDQLVTLIETLVSELGVKLQSTLDPGDNTPAIMASPAAGSPFNHGTFTVLNLPGQPRQTYRVSCVATLLYRTEFEVEAESPAQAIDFCVNRLDDMGNYIEPVAEKFLETEDESGWEAEPLNP